MKIAIIGAGAIGLSFAAIWTKSDQEITLFCRDESRANLLAKEGIILTRQHETNIIKVKTTANIQYLSEHDLIVPAVKAYDLESVLRAIKNHLNAKARVVLIQNGLEILKLASKYINSSRLIRAILTFGAYLESYNKVNILSAGEILLYTPLKDSLFMDILNAFKSTDFTIREIKDLKELEWFKTIVNSAINPLSAIVERENGFLIENSLLKEIFIKVADESTKVAKKLGITFHEDPVHAAMDVARKTANNYSSMLQDIRKGKKTEIDFINGKIIEYGKQIGVNVDLNKMLYAIIKAKEQSK